MCAGVHRVSCVCGCWCVCVCACVCVGVGVGVCVSCVWVWVWVCVSCVCVCVCVQWSAIATSMTTSSLRRWPRCQSSRPEYRVSPCATAFLSQMLESKLMRTHTKPFNGPLSGTTRVSRYQKGKTNLDFTEARDSEWQWHQLGHMQVCSSLRTDNHASTPPLSFLQAGCSSCRPTNSLKALKAI